MSTPDEAAERSSRHRDWFGYVFTAIIGIVATILVAWYQLYTTEKEAASAELERARLVKQVSVAIVEEHALNGKKLEIERLARLIDQRRRDEHISIPISVSEVVEQAEFNIASSHHLSVDRKEEIKPIFDSFYADLRSRAFQPLTSSSGSSDLVNEIARKIQEGKSSEALAALKRLDEAHAKEVAEALKAQKPGLVEGLRNIFESPYKAIVFMFGIFLYFFVAFRVVRWWQRRKWRRVFE